MRLRCGSGDVRMPAPVGPFFWPLPVLAPWWLFWVFLLNLGSTTPNYPRRPLMRSSKAPPNQKNRGQFLPQPTRTHRSWHPNLPGSRIGAASNSAPHLRVSGGVMLSPSLHVQSINLELNAHLSHMNPLSLSDKKVMEHFFIHGM
jgi:hypothetical protein